MHNSIEGGNGHAFFACNIWKAPTARLQTRSRVLAQPWATRFFGRSHDFNLIDETFLFMLTTYSSCAL
jgi:hypothetical protein